MTVHIITGPVSFLCLAIVVVAIARKRTGKRRAEIEQARRVRQEETQRVRARWNAGMPARHPETPGADDPEAKLLADLVNGFDITNPGGTQ